MKVDAPAERCSGLVVGDCSTRLWGVTGTERAHRILEKAGAELVDTADAAVRGVAPCLIIRADWVIDAALVTALGQMPGSVLVTNSAGGTVVLAANVSAGDISAVTAAIETGEELPGHLHSVLFDPANGPLYLPILRKRLYPVVLPLNNDTLDAAERATFSGSYKGVTDFVTKYVWPAPARHVTRWCAEAGITPNMVTFVSFALAMATPFLFADGRFVAGLLAAWVMTFLDTVDGKLARCTMKSSRFGEILDHGTDLITPPFWWWGWHIGCLATGATYPAPALVLATVIGGYVVLRLQEGFFKLKFGMHIHVWRQFDSVFRLVVSRRNPILVILSLALVFGVPGYGFVAVGVWTAVSFLVHAIQITQALGASRNGSLMSWMAR